MIKTFPTLYAMGHIGVNDTREAIKAFHFCSLTCRDAFKAKHQPFTDGGWAEGDETLSLDLLVCEFCGGELEGGK